MVSNFDYKHRCLIEKNVPMALILPSRWQDGSESLGIERTSCLCLYDRRLALCCARLDSFAPISLIQKRSERNQNCKTGFCEASCRMLRYDVFESSLWIRLHSVTRLGYFCYKRLFSKWYFSMQHSH